MAETRTAERIDTATIDVADPDITGKELAQVDRKAAEAGQKLKDRTETICAEILARRDKFATFLQDSGIRVELFVEVANRAFIKTPSLITDCTASSLLMALMDCARDGLVPDGKKAAIIPYWDAKLRKKVAQYVPMVQGLLDVAYRGGSIRDIEVEVVYAGEHFKYRRGSEAYIDHQPPLDRDPRAKIEGAYCIVTTIQGGRFLEVIGATELKKIADVNKAQNGPGKEWPAEMAKKGVIRRVWKRLPRTRVMDAIFDRDTKTYVVAPESELDAATQTRIPTKGMFDDRRAEPQDRGEAGDDRRDDRSDDRAAGDDQQAQGGGEAADDDPPRAEKHPDDDQQAITTFEKAFTDATTLEALQGAVDAMVQTDVFDSFRPETISYLEAAHSTAEFRIKKAARPESQPLHPKAIMGTGQEPKVYEAPNLWASDLLGKMSVLKKAQLTAFWKRNRDFIREALEHDNTRADAERIVTQARKKGLELGDAGS